MPKELEKEEIVQVPIMTGAFSVRPCAYCNKEFVGWNKTKYCSVVCRKAGFFQPTKLSGINKSCKQCNKEFYVSPSASGQLYRDNNCLDNIEILCPNCHAIEHYAKPIEGVTLSG